MGDRLGILGAHQSLHAKLCVDLLEHVEEGLTGNQSLQDSIHEAPVGPVGETCRLSLLS